MDDLVLLPANQYTSLGRYNNAIVFRYHGPIYFATIDSFKHQLLEKCSLLTEDAKNNSVNAKIVKPSHDKENGTECKERQPRAAETSLVSGKEDEECVQDEDIMLNDIQTRKVLIVDCSSVSFADTSGARLLIELCEQFTRRGGQLVLSNCCREIQHRLAIVEKSRRSGSSTTSAACQLAFYPSVQDAIVSFEISSQCIH